MDSNSVSREDYQKSAVSKKFDRLEAASNIDRSSLIEYAGLCIEGRVHSAWIEGRDRSYAITGGDDQITFGLQESDPGIVEEDELVEMQSLMLGLARVNARITLFGRWSSQFPSPKFIEKISADERITETTQKIHSLSNLTLADLHQIAHWCSRLRNNEADTIAEPTFRTVFPSSFRDCLRHHSGNEVLLHRDNDGIIASHRIDAPNPADDLIGAWFASLKRKPPGTRADASARWKRWKLSQMLGTIPDVRKPDVFNWVNETIWKIEEYHSSHGRQPSASRMEFYFDDCVIFANDNLEFELIRM